MRRSVVALVSAVLTLAGGLAPLGAGTATGAVGAPHLVKDVNTAPPVVMADSVQVGSLVVFVKRETGARELWRSDGSPAGTFRLARFRASRYLWDEPSSLAVSGAEVFLGADDGVHGRELWATDGSVGGTRMVRDVAPGRASGFLLPPTDLSTADQLVPAGGRVYFNGPAASGQGTSLWSSDGTTAGTRRVSDLEPQNRAAVGAEIYFVVSGPTGHEIWRSDGSSTGTRQVAVLPGGSDRIGSLAALSDRVVFERLSGYDPDQDDFSLSEVWSTNAGGTAATELRSFAVRDSEPRKEFAARGGEAFFVAASAEGDSQLWKTDGTDAGTVGVRVFPEADVWTLVLLGPSLYLQVEDLNTAEHALWVSDGTDGGTRLAVRGSVTGGNWLGDLRAASGRLYFTAEKGAHGREVWTSDGTEAGTRELTALAPGPRDAHPQLLSSTGSYLLLTGFNLPEGTSLWRTDGTPAGTERVTTIDPRTAGSWPTEVTRYGGRTLFVADQQGGADGPADPDFWSAGPAANALTRLTPPGTGFVTMLTPTPRGVFFEWAAELSITDGTRAGTRRVHRDFCSELHRLTAAGSRAYFAANRGCAGGNELYTSDGTRTGTRRVADINPGDRGSAPRELTGVGRRLYFSANDGRHGRELWLTNGTGSGTRLVRDIRPGGGKTHADPQSITKVGRTVFFTARDGRHGRELWRTDGTARGTRLVKDIAPGRLGSEPLSLVNVGGTLYFTAYDRTHGRELWRSDGTRAGTRRVTDLVTGRGTASPTALTAYGRRLLFAADDGVHGDELWTSDGTAAGTEIVSDLRPGPSGSAPAALTRVTGGVAFAADDGIHGRELWISNGTAAGTSLVGDINPSGSSSPRDLAWGQGVLAFSADDGLHGREVWSVPVN